MIINATLINNTAVRVASADAAQQRGWISRGSHAAQGKQDLGRVVLYPAGLLCMCSRCCALAGYMRAIPSMCAHVSHRVTHPWAGPSAQLLAHRSQPIQACAREMDSWSRTWGCLFVKGGARP